MSNASSGASACPYPDSAVMEFPSDGAVRVHPTPDQLPAWRRDGEHAPYRFDDPDPQPGPGAFRVRYLASTLRGCLLEVLAGFRPANEETQRLLAAVANVEDDDEHPDVPRRGLGSYLQVVRVGRAFLLHGTDQDVSADGQVVTIHDTGLLAWLDRHPRVRQVLDSPEHRGTWDEPAHLDEGLVRLGDSAHGRPLTQACSRALFDDGQPQPIGIHYRSKHDDREDCWALYEHARVTFREAALDLSPDVPEHLKLIQEIADMWDLDLPERWQEHR